MANRAGHRDGQVIATVKDKFGEDREVVQRGSRIRIAMNRQTPILALNRAACALMGEKIKAARLAQGLTLEECAMRAGMVTGWPKNRMFEIESGSRGQGIRMGTLYAVAEALKVEVAELLPSVAEAMALGEVTSPKAKVVTLSSRGRVVA